MKMYAVMKLEEDVNIGISTHISKSIYLTWYDGMIGVIPVFDDIGKAKEVAGDKYTIHAMETTALEHEDD
jgi:hypothetical protein